jgi:hypothetical protein
MAEEIWRTEIMEYLFAIFFGLPSIFIILLLSFIGVYQTLSDVYTAVTVKNFTYLSLVLVLTILAALVGYVLGGFI